MLLFGRSVISDRLFQIKLWGQKKTITHNSVTLSITMNNFKRHFTEEAFLFSTFVEFNKCWSSGKKSRLVIESFNGFAFVNFSAFLGHPKTMHFAPREKRDPGRKSKKKSKRKTQRDNERAARFQERFYLFFHLATLTYSPKCYGLLITFSLIMLDSPRLLLSLSTW